MLRHTHNFLWGKPKSSFFQTIGLLFLLISAIAMALPFFTGLVGGSDTSSLALPPDNYGKPNQSRIWYNSNQGRWDALIPRNDGGSFSQSDHYIMTDVPGAQTFTTVELADRDNSRPDVFWDDQNKKLYVLASHPGSSQFWRLGYDDVSDSYNFEVGVAGTGVTVPSFTHNSGNTPASIYVTPNGRVWLAVMKNNPGLQVQHSSDGGATWMDAPVILDPDAMLGVTTWIDFENNGTTFVGVFAGENGEMVATTDFFFWYIDQDADPSDPSVNWFDDSANIPAPVGSEQSDDHVSAARDLDDNQYFAVKTESGGPTDPLIKLFKRTPAGIWSQFKVTETQEVPEESRPSIVIDDENREIYIYTNGAEVVSATEREGSRVKASLDSLGDLATAPFVPIFSQPNTVFTDLITPKHTVDLATNIVVLAHNRFDETVWYSEEEIQPSPVSVPSVVGLSQADAEQAIVDAGLIVGNITSENSDTVPVGDVISQNPVGGSVVAQGSAVDLLISLGPATVAVPDVLGLSQAAAEAAIVSANLVVGAVSTANSNTVPAGNVISQNPVGGSVVAQGSAVDLVISLGPATVAVPDVLGLSQAAAEAAIVSANLVVGAVSTANSDTVPAGNVSSQNPAGGSVVPPGTAVDLVISLGPATVAVPDVVGLSQAAAEAAIVAANLAVGAVGTANSDTVPAGNVISQNPGNPESVRDNFNTSSFTNNNGTFNWTGGWIEVDGDGAGPTAGNVRINNGRLSLDDRPNTGGEPSLAREADLSGFTVATLSFSFQTTSGVDPSDSVVVEISNDGGANWTVLEDFTGISGSFAGTRSLDVSSFISNETRIRFRVNNLYGGSSEKFRVDNVEFEVTGNLEPVGTPIDLVVSLGPVAGDDDDDSDDSDDGDDSD